MMNICRSECESGQFLYKNCPKGTYGSCEICDKCDISCAECEGDSKTCTNCENGLYSQFVRWYNIIALTNN